MSLTMTPQETEMAQKLAPDALHFQKVLFNERVLIFRNPSQQEYKYFRTIYDQPNGELKALEALAGTLCVQPSPEQWQADLLRHYPGAGINVDVQKAMLLLTGMTSQETAK